MKAALDVFYSDLEAHAACVVFDTWSAARPLSVVRITVPGVRPYRSGRFFERELPPLLAVLERSGTRFSHVIVDGYVHLKNNERGLGGHLRHALPYPAVVIGVAKNPLAIADHFVTIHRGRSTKPLFISVAGGPLEEATKAIGAMHGPFRIPTLLREADRIARRACCGSGIAPGSRRLH